MMSRSHAMSGAAAGIALFSTFALPLPAFSVAGHKLGGATVPLALGLGRMSTPYVAIMCVIVMAATLLPDWDRPDSCTAMALPPLTRLISRLLTTPGRQGLTRAPAGIALITAVTTLVVSPTMRLSGMLIRPGNGIVLMLMSAMGVRALGMRIPVILWGVGVMGLLSGVTLPATALWFMPTAVALGMWTHRVDDILTSQGAENPLWPLRRWPRVSLPLLDGRENTLFLLLGLYTTAGAVQMMVSAWA